MKIHDFLRLVRVDTRLEALLDYEPPQQEYASSSARYEEYRLARQRYAENLNLPGRNRVEEERETKEALEDANRKEFREKLISGFMVPLFRKVSLAVVKGFVQVGFTLGRLLIKRLLVPVARALVSTVARGIIWTAVRFLVFTPIGLGISLVVGSLAGLHYIWKKYQKKEDDPREIQTASEFKTQRGLGPKPEAPVQAVPLEPKSPTVSEGYRKPIPSKQPSEIKELVPGIEPQKERITPSERRVKDLRAALRTHRKYDLPGILAEVEKKTGIEANVLAAILYKESTFDPQAKAKTSSAYGLAQFIDSTWNGLMKGRWIGIFKEYGFDTRKMNRGNPRDSAFAVAIWYKHEVIPELRKRLGKIPSLVELYMGHFMGYGAAALVIKNLPKKPDSIAALDYPVEANANKHVFFVMHGKIKGRGKTYREIYDSFAASLTSSYHAYDVVKNETVPVEETAPVIIPASSPPVKKPAPTAPTTSSIKSSTQVSRAPKEFYRIGDVVVAA